MTKQYENFKVWFNSLKGMEIDKHVNYLQTFITHPEIDYVVQPNTLIFPFNKTTVSEINDKYIFEYELPRYFDIVLDITSIYNDELTVRINGEKLNNLNDPILLVAAQHHRVVVQMFIDKTNVKSSEYGFQFGFNFNSIYFKNEHRKKLVETPWIVEDHCRYSNGRASVILFPINKKHDKEQIKLIPPEDALMIQIQNEEYLYKWPQIFDSYMKENHKDSVKNDSKYRYLYDMLIHIPQLKIIHGDSWRDKLKYFFLEPGVIFAIKNGYDPDVSTYISKYDNKQKD